MCELTCHSREVTPDLTDLKGQGGGDKILNGLLCLVKGKYNEILTVLYATLLFQDLKISGHVPVIYV